MLTEHKLTSIIEIAMDGGWQPPISGEFQEIWMDPITGEYQASFSLPGDLEVHVSAMLFLFFHDFAKAIWGESQCSCDSTSSVHVATCQIFQEDWKHHLQQAVLSDNPLQYYWENLG